MKKGFVKTAGILAAIMMLFAAGCSTDSSSGSSDGSKPVGSDSTTGTIGITVNVDGSISCAFCKKVYQKKADAEACEHYKCSTCGSGYATEEEKAACTEHVTIQFVDSTGVNETLTYTIKSGNSVSAPDWKVEGSDTIWTSDKEGYDIDSESFTDSVIFTASWKTFVECPECGEHCADAEAAEAHALADKTCDECGAVCESKTAAEAHALADKTCVECKTVCESKAAAEAHAAADKICTSCGKAYEHKAGADACEHYKCTGCGTVYMSQAELDACVHVTVTFKDSEYEGSKEAVVKTIKSGTTTTAPVWTRENYTLAWDSEIASEITVNTTYTAVWTELPKCDNCGTHYATQSAADNCGKQEGCPKYGALTTITFSGSKAASAVCDSPAVTVELSGNISTNKVTYNGKEYSPILKLETSTSIKLTGVAGKKITLVTTGTATNKGVYVLEEGADSKVRVNGAADGIIEYTATQNVVTITKDDSRNCAVIFIE